MYSSAESDMELYRTDLVCVELTGDGVPDGDMSDFGLDNLSDADQLFLSSLSDLFEKHLMLRKEPARQHLSSVLKQGEKCQCPSCKSFAQDLLEDFTRTWGE